MNTTDKLNQPTNALKAMDFKEVRVSHSSITDFNNCKRLYYFKNYYRNPETNNRVQIVNPYLSLGSAVHEAIDKVVNLSVSRRQNFSLIQSYDKIWKKRSGKKGGFLSEKQEKEFRKRGAEMLKKVERSALFKKKNVKREKELPRKALFNNTYLIGSYDWVEVLKNNNLHIIDFKTGRSEEKNDSWQLPIYQILAQENHDRKVEKTSYWYLSKNQGLVSRKPVDSEVFLSEIEKKALEMEKVVEKKKFSCSSNYPRCYWCHKYEKVVSGGAEYLGTDEMGKDLFYVVNGNEVLQKVKESDFLSDNEKEILETRLNEKNFKGKKEILETIKKKLKKNLSRRELFSFVQELKKNDRRFEF
jgi:hypothetical protein